MHSLNTSRQKAISALMILIMLALPFLSMMPVSALSMQSMQQQAAMQNSMQRSQFVAIEKSTTTQNMLDNKHSCCDEAKTNILKDCCKNCLHGGQCDCDSAQIGYSLPITVQTVTLAKSLKTSFDLFVSNTFISTISDSLYRPPISRL